MKRLVLVAMFLFGVGLGYLASRWTADQTNKPSVAMAAKEMSKDRTVLQLNALEREIRLVHKETMRELNEQLIEPLATVEYCRMELERQRPEPTDEEVRAELDKLWK